MDGATAFLKIQFASVLASGLRYTVVGIASPTYQDTAHVTSVLQRNRWVLKKIIVFSFISGMQFDLLKMSQ